MVVKGQDWFLDGLKRVRFILLELLDHSFVLGAWGLDRVAFTRPASASFDFVVLLPVRFIRFWRLLNFWFFHDLGPIKPVLGENEALEVSRHRAHTDPVSQPCPVDLKQLSQTAHKLVPLTHLHTLTLPSL